MIALKSNLDIPNVDYCCRMNFNDNMIEYSTCFNSISIISIIKIVNFIAGESSFMYLGILQSNCQYHLVN